MLVLTRNTRQSIIIETSDGDIEVVVHSVSSQGQVKLGFFAPDEVSIIRAELFEKEKS